MLEVRGMMRREKGYEVGRMHKLINMVRLVGLLVLLVACLPMSVQATITGLVTIPTSQHIAVGQTSSFTVTWVVSSDAGPFVRSDFGSFGTSDLSLGRVNTVLNKAVSSRTGAVASFSSGVSFVESILVPSSVAVAAQHYGLSTISYSRDFVDGSGIPVTGSVSIDFTSALGAAFGISREALSFDDDSPVRIVQLNDKLNARAELTLTGTGLLQAAWEVASPPSTQGEPFFQPLSQVQQHLTAGISQTLQSPSLPVTLPGLYLVRLRVINPATAFEAPVIRYFVGEGRPGHGLPPTPVSLIRPANRTLLAEDTQFTWQAVRDARIYQLEIYSTAKRQPPILSDISLVTQGPTASEVNAALQQRPVTGVLISDKDTHTILSGAVRTHLLPGQEYYWRLLAIDADGVIIGQSPVRELRTP